MPHWLNALLKERFDQHCEHGGHNGSQKNLFCLECRISICKDCDDHTDHRLLKVTNCTYWYCDMIFYFASEIALHQFSIFQIFTYRSGGNHNYAVV